MSNAPAPTIAVAGYLSLDDITLSGCTARGVPGGGALYACLGVLAAGGRPALFARVGTDFPRAVLGALAQAGVALAGVETGTVPSRRARLVYQGADARSSNHYGEAAWWGRTESLRPPPPGAGFDAMALTPMPAGYAREALCGCTTGCHVVLDTSEAFAERDRDVLLALLGEIEVFTPSRAETRRLLPGCGDDAAAVKLTSRTRTVVQKRGPDGLVLARSNAILARRKADPGPVADPTGAGDAVTGALAVAVARALDADAMLSLAAGVARRAVAGIGASALGLASGAEGGLDMRPCT